MGNIIKVVNATSNYLLKYVHDDDDDDVGVYLFTKTQQHTYTQAHIKLRNAEKYECPLVFAWKI